RSDHGCVPRARLSHRVIRGFLEEVCPCLRGSPYELLEPGNTRYNSFAWAGGDTARWWHPAKTSPSQFWPGPAGREYTMRTVVDAYRALGYEIGGWTGALADSEQICLYSKDGRAAHAARQDRRGVWTSKLGALNLIKHRLNDLEGGEYGSIECFMRRPAFS